MIIKKEKIEVPALPGVGFDELLLLLNFSDCFSLLTDRNINRHYHL